MKDYTPRERGKGGRLICIYGATGSGKTTSSLATLPEPILAVLSEPRDIEPSLEAIQEAYKRTPEAKFKIPEGYDDFVDFLGRHAEKETLPYKSLLIDSFSYFYNVSMKMEAEIETYDAGIFGKEEKGTGKITHKRKFLDQFRLDQPAYGGLSSAAIRLLRFLGFISQKGVIVVCTALRDENPNWSYSLSEAPAFIGKAFPINAPGLFDLIGRVRERKNEAGKVIRPPLVDFESDGSFMAKWTGKPGKTSGPLDFKAILKKD